MTVSPGVRVQKFGGTSLATPQHLADVAEIVKRAVRSEGPAVVVVSAMGRSTDQLLARAREVSAGPNAETSGPDPREVDQLLATGEVASAALLALALRGKGVPAVSLSCWQAGIRATGPAGRANVATIAVDRIRCLLDDGLVVVVAGFQGVGDNGDVVTLGRGGSDTTAVALAAALGQPVCHIYTDVDGVHTGDPQVVPATRRISTVEPDLLAEMSHAGAQVVHARAAELAAARSVQLHVASTFGDGDGTRVMDGVEPPLEVGARVVAVCGDPNVARVSIRAGTKPLPARETFAVLAAHAVPVDLVSTGTDALTFTVSAADVRTVRACLSPGVATADAALRIEEQVGKASVVGRGLLGDTACVARTLTTLAGRGIRYESLCASHTRIATTVSAGDLTAAVNALHDEFGLERPASATRRRNLARVY
jgi:aspartate kinase